MNHFLVRESVRHGRSTRGFTPRAVRAMLSYAFPGNVRELQNLVERGVISAEEGGSIDVPHLFRREQLSDETLLAIGAHGALSAPKQEAPAPLLQAVRQVLASPGLHDVEGQLLREALKECNGNVAAAARLLGLSRAQFAYKLGRTAVPARPRSRRKPASGVKPLP